MIAIILAGVTAAAVAAVLVHLAGETRHSIPCSNDDMVFI